MRQPTDIHEAMLWWRNAVIGAELPRQEGNPQLGYFAMRYVKGGPLVPVRIYLEQDIDEETGELVAPEIMRCVVGESEAVHPDDVWLRVNPISRERYEALLAMRAADPLRMKATHAPLDIDTPTLPPKGPFG